MIRACLETSEGPIGLVGVNVDNIVMLKAGNPLDIDLGAITPPGKRLKRVIIAYGVDYEDIINDWKKQGLPVRQELVDKAVDMDKKMRETRRGR